jgi:predicted Zn-ribbon and HTH transcriptional regulator
MCISGITNNNNYYNVEPNSQHFDDIDQIIEFIKITNNIDELRIILENTKKFGYQLIKSDVHDCGCKNCGYKYQNLKLSEREWLCPICGRNHNRDYNASVNIKNEGQKILGQRLPEVTLVDYPLMDDKADLNGEIEYNRFALGVKKYGFFSEFSREYHSMLAQLKHDELNEFFDLWNVPKNK